MESSLNYRDLLLEALGSFRERLFSQVPLELKHFSEFLEEENIKKVAKMEKINALKEFFHNLSKLEDLDEEKVIESCKTFRQVVKMLIFECIGKHKEYKSEAVIQVEKKIHDLCHDMKTTLEAKLFLNPEMDVKSIETFFEKGKSLSIHSFELQWHHGNVDFLQAQKEVLIHKFQEMKLDMLEKQKNILEKMSQLEPRAVIPAAENENFSHVNISEGEKVIEDVAACPESERNSMIAEVSSDITRTSQIEVKVEEEKSAKLSPEITHANTVKTEMDSPIEGVRIATDIFENDIELSDIETEPEQNDSDSNKSENIEKRKRPDTMENTEVENGTTSKRPRLQSEELSNGNNDDMRYPLIFRLASETITIGTRMGESFAKLKQEVPVLGVNEYGLFICGSDAFQLNCDMRWNLTDFLGDNPRKKKITIIKGNKVITQELNLEFFLGFFLRNMKMYAEKQLNKTFDSAVITIPSWLCSSKRISIKDAGIIAGFTTVDLLNQESVGIASHVFRGSRDNSWNCDILVLSECFGIVSAILYECRRGKVKPVGEEYKIYSELLWKKKGKAKKIGRKANDIYSSLRSSKRLDNARTVDKLLFITDSTEWLRVFMVLADKLGYTLDGDEILPASELYGASILCEKNVDEVHEILREYFPSCIRPCRYGDNNVYRSMYKIIPSDTKLPKKIELQVPANMEKLTIVQENLLCHKFVTLCELQDFNWPCKNKSSELLLTFEITREAVLHLEGITVKDTKKIEKLRKDAYTWLTPNLSDGEKEKIRELVHSIFPQNNQANEYFVVV